MTLSPGAKIGAYEIVTALGAGGMGEVYRARDTRLDRDVALKILPEALAGDADRLMRFEREAKTLAALNHPNISAIHGIEGEGGVSESGDPLPRALVMEFVEGEDLSQRITRGAIPLDEALPIARQIAEALEAAHDAGIVHRDLKPANVRVRADGTVKVLDFGLAKGVEAATSAARSSGPSQTLPTMTSPALTGLGVVLGTASYMAPEQAKGKPVDRRADIWAFGVVLYEMLTGERAFAGEDVSDVLVAVLSRDVDLARLPGATPPRVRGLLARCLDRNPRTRLQHIGEARLVLEQPAADDADPHGSAAGKQQPWWRRPRIWLLMALVATASSVLTGWLKQPPAEVPAPVVRFDVALPGSVFGNPTNRPLAISPLGTDLAFERDQKLWVHHFADHRTVALAPGVDQVRAPFFSSDGRSIGFFAHEKALRVPVTGGPVEILGGPVPQRPCGVDWASDGHVYVGIEGRIARFPGGGQPPEFVVDVKPEEVACDPQLLPGGEWLLFTLRKPPADWSAAQIVVESLRDHQRRVILSGGQAARVTATGHLLYVSGSTLYGRTFDAARLSVTSDPVALVNGVGLSAGSMTGAASYDVSQRGDLVYGEFNTGFTPPAQLAWFDREGRQTLLPIEPAPFLDSALSPDGRRIVTSVRKSERDQQLWAHFVDRPGGLPLTSAGFNIAPVWSPDGEWIYFSHQDPARPNGLEIWRRHVDGSGDDELVARGNPGDFVMPMSISSDGRLLAAATLTAKKNRIDLLRLDGRSSLEPLDTPRRLPVWPTLSPDGRFVAYQSDVSGDRAVFVQEIATGRSQVISSADAVSPTWSRSGREIFFISHNALQSVRVVSLERLEFAPPETLFRLPFDWGAGAAYGAGSSRGFDDAPGGQRFLFAVPVEQGSEGRNGLNSIHVVLNWFQELQSKVPAGRR